MSIATDEAEEFAPEPNGPENQIRAWAHENRLQRHGYVAGRSAEPTFEEIDVLSDLIKQSIISILESSGTGYTHSPYGNISFSVNGVVEIVNTRDVAEQYLNDLRQAVTE